MIDFEDDLRRRLHDAAAAQTVPPGHLDRVERRARRVARRRPVAQAVAVAAAAIALVAGAIVITAGGGGDGATQMASSGPTTEATAVVPPGWATMADSPLAPRHGHLTLAMGDEVLVSGGYSATDTPVGLVDGAVYDAAADTWTAIPDAPLSASAAVGVWTGEEAIVVTSGSPPANPQDAADAGGPAEAAAFDPATKTWRELADPPADLTPLAASAAWTGTHVVVLGHPATGQASLTTTTIYDPATDTWTAGTPTDLRPAAGPVVWTGSELVLVAAAGVNQVPQDSEIQVRAYDPATDTWRSIPWGLEGGDRGYPVVAWTGDRLFIGGGTTYVNDNGLEHARQAALLDVETGTWTATSPAPIPIYGPEVGASLWTGDRVLTLNGADGDVLPTMGEGQGTAVTYDPATDTWAIGAERPGDGIARAAWAWAADRAVVPFGGYWTTLRPDGNGGTVGGCCTAGPTGGAAYAP